MTTSPERESSFWPVLRVASGNFLEMYDFMVFGYYASSIAKAFFPGHGPFVSLMLSLMTFGAGFLMRPVGAVVLSNKQAYAFAVDPGGDVVHRRVLTLGVDGGEWFEVKAGLHAGDEVVVAGAESIVDGMKVRAARGPDPFAAGPVTRDAAGGAH